eukprot:2684537-Alexandrium_andersonii.AAC.1
MVALVAAPEQEVGFLAIAAGLELRVVVGRSAVGAEPHRCPSLRPRQLAALVLRRARAPRDVVVDQGNALVLP